MLLKLAVLSMLAATTHLEQAGTNQVQWIYDSGANKGYVCGVMQQNGAKYDVYLPALYAAAMQKMGSATTLTAVPWLHFASQRDALDAMSAYCPVDTSSSYALNSAQ